MYSGFLGYHLYLVSQGTTTNETHKWGECAGLTRVVHILATPRASRMSVSSVDTPSIADEARSAHRQLTGLREQYLKERHQCELRRKKQNLEVGRAAVNSSREEGTVSRSGGEQMVALTPCGAFMRGYDLRQHRGEEEEVRWLNEYNKATACS